MPSKVPTNIISVLNILGVTSGRRTKSYIFYWCFNFLNMYTTTKCKWYFMLDASTNSTYTTTKYKWGFERKQLQNECKYKKVGPTPLSCTKRPLAGNLYCSPSPPLYVAEIWRKIDIYILWKIKHVWNHQPAVDELTSCWLFSLLQVFFGMNHDLLWDLLRNKKNLHILTPRKKDMRLYRDMKSENGVPKSTGWWWFQLFPPWNGQNLG